MQVMLDRDLARALWCWKKRINEAVKIIKINLWMIFYFELNDFELKFCGRFRPQSFIKQEQIQKFSQNKGIYIFGNNT